MITTPNLTLSELKQIFLEILLNKTDKVSDISDDSVLNAVAFGSAKIGQKCIKDIAIVESQLMPETAKEEYLDNVAMHFGVSPRRGVLGSSTYIKVVADEGTQYLANTHSFVNTNGIRFEMENDFTVGSAGIGYIKVRSIDTGSKTNVEFGTINSVTPTPSTHKRCTNEYQATGAIDAETDEVFRVRIMNNKNFLSLTTLEYYNQLLQEIDDRILKILNLGKNETGKQILAVVTQNGVDLTDEELNNLLNQIKEYLPISDLNQFGDVVGIELQNVTWFEIDVDFRAEFEPTYNVDEVRIDIQTNLTKLIDFRFWKQGQKVEWDDMLESVKNTIGVKYVPDNYFSPSSDQIIPTNKLPRIKGFIMRDIYGSIIFDSNGVLIPVFYPTE